MFLLIILNFQWKVKLHLLSARFCFLSKMN